MTEKRDGMCNAVKASQLLDRIGVRLLERGYSLEELIESGGEIRGELLREMYGIPVLSSAWVSSRSMARIRR